MLNLEVYKTAWRNKELRNKILFVLGILLLFRAITFIPVPVPNAAGLQRFLLNLFQNNNLLGFANLFSGGAMSNFSVVLMGVGPFINASIIIQLLSHVVPKLEALTKEGEQGRNKLNQYTRVLTIPLAALQSFGMVAFIRQATSSAGQADLIGNPTLIQWITMITTITAGTMFLVWLGELITEKGVGNGISLLIFAGIVADLPRSIGQVASLAQGDSSQLFSLILFAIISLLIVAGIVFINEGQRNIPISYAKRTVGVRTYSSVDTHLPIKVITAGVIPIIFALAFLSVPGFLGQALKEAKTGWIADIASNLSVWFSPTNTVYAVTYFLLVIAFTYFYTTVVFNPKDVAENLQKRSGFIPGVRPGTETQKYLAALIRRITLAGSLALAIIAVLPFMLQRLSPQSSALNIGGTGLLITVAVVIETMRQIEAQALTATYDKY